MHRGTVSVRQPVTAVGGRCTAAQSQSVTAAGAGAPRHSLSQTAGHRSGGQVHRGTISVRQPVTAARGRCTAAQSQSDSRSQQWGAGAPRHNLSQTACHRSGGPVHRGTVSVRQPISAAGGGGCTAAQSQSVTAAGAGAPRHSLSKTAGHRSGGPVHRGTISVRQPVTAARGRCTAAQSQSDSRSWQWGAGAPRHNLSQTACQCSGGPVHRGIVSVRQPVMAVGGRCTAAQSQSDSLSVQRGAGAPRHSLSQTAGHGSGGQVHRGTVSVRQLVSAAGGRCTAAQSQSDSLSPPQRGVGGGAPRHNLSQTVGHRSEGLVHQR